MADPGDVVTVSFPGVAATKRRPAVVVSTPAYHTVRPDVILGLLTTQVGKASMTTDYLLQDWIAAGLHNQSSFRSFLQTMPASQIQVIGKLSVRDWHEVQARLRLALAVT